MKGYEYFKNIRSSKGYTLKSFAIQMEMSASNVQLYENGKRSITLLPVYKAIQMFSELDIPIEGFFDDFYPYKEDIDIQIAQWKQDNPPELHYDTLKQRFWTRFSKMKARKTVSTEKFDVLYNRFYEVLDKAQANKNELGYITQTFYDDIIVNFLCEIRQMSYESCGNPVSDNIMAGIMKTEYTSQDVAKFIGMNATYFRDCLKGRYDFQKMHVITALKLCYVLDLDFHKIFRINDM